MSEPTLRTVVLFDDPIAQLRQMIESLPTMRVQGIKELHVDFSRVTLLSSMMLGLLVRSHVVSQREGIALKLDGLTEPMLKTLAISGIGNMLGVTPPTATS